MYKEHFSQFLEKTKKRIYFTAQSHHFWPDVTLDAQKQYWLDSSSMADDKWDYIFSEIIPTAQKNISEYLNTSKPGQIAFAPNTHEFVARIISCLDFSKSVKVLTTDSEFYSFSRQISRLEEYPKFEVNRISTEPFNSFAIRCIDEIDKVKYDLIFLSKVFFNSGFSVDNLDGIINSVDYNAIIFIDGYHSFFAIPENLKEIENRIFYLAGGYKYAMSGEGVCFLHIPENISLRPAFTGWFAEFGSLSNKNDTMVNYGQGGWRFMGATFDPSGLYRFNSVCRWMRENNLSIQKIHDYVISLQDYFISELATGRQSPIENKQLSIDTLITPINTNERGHFLTFRSNNAANLCNELKRVGVITDYRQDRLRIGFGLYHDINDINKLIEAINNLYL